MLKIDQAIALSDLGKLLPKTVFETYPSGEGVLSENLFISATTSVFGVAVINLTYCLFCFSVSGGIILQCI